VKPFSKTIAVFGSSAITQDSTEAQLAYRAGELLAKAKFKICNGGYFGAMEAASRGAVEAHGEVIGVISDVFSHRIPNPFLTETVETRDLLERIATLIRIADGYIILDGGIGTLAELFVAWNMVAVGWDKPILVIGDKLHTACHDFCLHTEIEEKHLNMLKFVPTIEEAVTYLEELFKHSNE
jgi:uncharacterized protein (TIGR00730 family)